MKKQGVVLMSMTLALGFFLGGCATKSDLEEMKVREMEISAKADQAAMDAQAAKVAADEALMKASEAERRAEERERIADEKMRKAEEMFQNSMKK